MNNTLVCFGIGIGMFILGVRTSFCCIPTLGSPFPRWHRALSSPDSSMLCTRLSL